MSLRAQFADLLAPTSATNAGASNATPPVMTESIAIPKPGLWQTHRLKLIVLAIVVIIGACCYAYYNFFYSPPPSAPKTVDITLPEAWDEDEPTHVSTKAKRPPKSHQTPEATDPLLQPIDTSRHTAQTEEPAEPSGGSE